MSVDAQWKFDDDLLDVTARHDGSQQTITAPAPAPSYVPGPYDRALSLDGSFGVSVPSSSFLNLMTVQQRTISVWFRADQVDTGAAKQVIYEEGANARGMNIYLFQGSLYAGGWNLDAVQGLWQDWVKIDTVQDDTWHHFVLLFDATGGFQAGFLDGQLGDLAAAAPIFDHQGSVKIGMNGDTIFHDTPSGTTETAPSPLVGDIDDLRVYNRFILVEELAGIYEFGRPQPAAAPPCLCDDPLLCL